MTARGTVTQKDFTAGSPVNGDSGEEYTLAERVFNLHSYHSEISLQPRERKILSEMHPALAALVNYTVAGGTIVAESIRCTPYGDWEIGVMCFTGDTERLCEDVATALGERVTAVCHQTFYPRNKARTS